MIDLKTIILILVVHFLADFVLQTQEQAEKKSTDTDFLIYHVATYTAVWLFISYTMLGTWWKPLIFAFLTFLAHYWTDYCTSRQVKRWFEKKNWHNGFVVIGADQILHYVQLLLTYLLLR